MKKLLVLTVLAVSLLQVRAFPEPVSPEAESPSPAIGSADDSNGAIPGDEKGKTSLTVGGYLQLWFIHEQVEDGSLQEVTYDPCEQEGSGFSINKARVSLEASHGDIGCRLMARLEGGSFGLLDAYGYFAPLDDYCRLVMGQMKIPSTYEALESDENLDFTSRSKFSEEIGNWSLSRSPSSVSQFTSTQTYQRDTGAALKGNIAGFSYFLMIGNGLGANLYIGGAEKKQTLYSNRFGAYMYAGRCSLDIMEILKKSAGIDIPLNSFSIGGHYIRNNHPNVLYNDQKTVLDIKRISWSADSSFEIMQRLRVTGMYGRGSVKDDFDYDGEPDYEYTGWEVKAMIVIIPKWFEAGFRYDEYTYRKSVYAGESTIATYTAGCNFFYGEHFSATANYKWKRTLGDLEKELDDDIFILQTQFRL